MTPRYEVIESKVWKNTTFDSEREEGEKAEANLVKLEAVVEACEAALYG